MPSALVARHDLSRAQNRRHVQIVSACVHYREIAPGSVLGVYLACVRQSGLFLYRKRIQFGTQHDLRSRAIFQDRHHSSPAHVFGDVVSGAPQARR